MCAGFVPGCASVTLGLASHEQSWRLPIESTVARAVLTSDDSRIGLSIRDGSGSAPWAFSISGTEYRCRSGSGRWDGRKLKYLVLAVICARRVVAITSFVLLAPSCGRLGYDLYPSTKDISLTDASTPGATVGADGSEATEGSGGLRGTAGAGDAGANEASGASNAGGANGAGAFSSAGGASNVAGAASADGGGDAGDANGAGGGGGGAGGRGGTSANGGASSRGGTSGGSGTGGNGGASGRGGATGNGGASGRGGTNGGAGTGATGGVSGTGGTTGAGGSGGSACPGTPPAAGGTTLIDDLEDGNGDIPNVDGRRGKWYTVNDGTAGTQNPSPSGTFVPVSGGAQGSNYSARTWGSGFTSWGAAMGVQLNAAGQNQCPYDVSRYSGVTFYAKGSGTVTISVATSATVPVDRGGTCTSGCLDYYATKVVLSSAWTSERIHWTDLKQAGWGTPVSFNASQVLFIEFEFGAGVSFDLYVDDLAFF